MCQHRKAPRPDRPAPAPPAADRLQVQSRDDARRLVVRAALDLTAVWGQDDQPAIDPVVDQSLDEFAVGLRLLVAERRMCDGGFDGPHERFGRVQPGEGAGRPCARSAPMSRARLPSPPACIAPVPCCSAPRGPDDRAPGRSSPAGPGRRSSARAVSAGRSGTGRPGQRSRHTSSRSQRPRDRPACQACEPALIRAARRVDGLLVGAGNRLRGEQVEAAVRAGAHFATAPATN